MKTQTRLVVGPVGRWIITSMFSAAQAAELSARWIWLAAAKLQRLQPDDRGRQKFPLDRPQSGVIRISADTFYRLYVNGQWVNDGPARNWPEHFEFRRVGRQLLLAGRRE